MQKFAMSRQSLLRVLLGVYLFPLWLVVFSLGVPPSDFPLCVLMLILALSGFTLARHESRAWRTIWTAGLIVAIVFGVLEVVAGRIAARQRSEHRSASYLIACHRHPHQAGSQRVWKSEFGSGFPHRRCRSWPFCFKFLDRMDVNWGYNFLLIVNKLRRSDLAGGLGPANEPSRI
jgi:hypothetical protein